MVEQAHAAMRAEVGLAVLQIHRALAAGADVFRQARQGQVVAQALAPLRGGHGLGAPLPLQVAVQGDDGLAPHQRRERYADDVAHIAAVAGQVGHQFDEEGEQRKEDEAPDKGPPGALAFLGKQPAGDGQQRQRERQAVQKHAQLDAPALGGQLVVGIALHGVQPLLRGLPALARVQQGLVLRLHGLLGLQLGGLEGVQRLGAGDDLGVVLGALGGAARGQPVGQGLALGLGGAARPGVAQARLLQRGLGVLLGLLRLLNLAAQRRGRAAIQKVVQQQRLLHLGQVADDGAAQADQKAGEHQRHQPQAAAKPFFRQTQCLAHVALRSFNYKFNSYQRNIQGCYWLFSLKPKSPRLPVAHPRGQWPP